MKINEPNKDRGLRLAIQHRNESPKKMTLSEDFTNRLMQRIGQQETEPKTEPMSKRQRTWLYTIIGAVAAGILLLLTFHYTHGNVDTGKGNSMAQQMEKQEQSNKPESQKDNKQVHSLQIEKPGNPVKANEGEQAPMIAQKIYREEKANAVSPQPHAVSEISKSSTYISTTDSLDYYIEKIERELAQVDESLYIDRMNKVIKADERLQRIVNSYILHTLDKEGRPQTAENMYNVKTEHDEE